MSNERSVTDDDPTLILELTASVDKNVVPDCDVLPQICIKGRFYSHAFTGGLRRDSAK